MAATDYLKTARGDEGSPPDGEAETDPDEPNRTSRIIILSDEEQKAFSQGQPGAEVSFTGRGNVEDDHLHVMSLELSQGEPEAAPGSEMDMARQVMQKVQPQFGMK
jgi:hypothetical protein